MSGDVRPALTFGSRNSSVVCIDLTIFIVLERLRIKVTCSKSLFLILKSSNSLVLVEFMSLDFNYLLESYFLVDFDIDGFHICIF